ncbi:hypothetical protein PRECH8_19890 [Insulibacter thermoxylanivorax]|uniref:Release factor glutamine methyltransferase n=1 Tax=Insulibacter thermoxylanivorax TaxID=2749268 RepID=A0A916VG87_9BACL|nr:HemK/PrmC family methyltransferase [Insulibacter thermoxylanivorax]GFR38693.1 hypothetical protein PRECH8_19890 [Insulibacter thermoxylanivorax]
MKSSENRNGTGNQTTRKRTVREAYRWASSLLLRGGIEDADRHAEWLVQEVLGWDRTQFLLRWDEPFPLEKEAELEQMAERRLKGEPLQYIIGEQEFYGLPFRVNPAVLIPRPETELLVEEVIKRGKAWGAGGTAAAPAEAPLRVIDVGTGSGAIAVTLAVKCPAWQITATDISAAALETARGNAARHGVMDRITWVQGDLLSPWLAADGSSGSSGSNGSNALDGSSASEELQGSKESDGLSGSNGPNRSNRSNGSNGSMAPFDYDILVSNPPYIPDDEIETLQVEVRQYEPRSALSGGPDGLHIYARLVEQLQQLERKPRLVALEVGQGQHEAVGKMLAKLNEWDEITYVPDLAGIQRHVIAMRRD